MSKVRIEAGRLLWNEIRNCVREARHAGYQITVEEGAGFLSRPFWFSGPQRDLDIFGEALEKHLTGEPA